MTRPSVCQECGGSLPTTPPRARRYCSRKCQRRAGRRRYLASRPEIELRRLRAHQRFLVARLEAIRRRIGELLQVTTDGGA